MGIEKRERERLCGGGIVDTHTHRKNTHILFHLFITLWIHFKNFIY